jgi:hypothetical protein
MTDWRRAPCTKARHAGEGCEYRVQIDIEQKRNWNKTIAGILCFGITSGRFMGMSIFLLPATLMLGR